MLSQLDFSFAIIDLDNTLYEANNGVFARMDSKMNDYIQRELQVGRSEADFLRVKYWKEYGSTLKGLMKHHGHDAEPFLREVHDIQAHELLQAQPELHRVLDAMHCEKVIHTNGTREHAEAILKALGIRSYFKEIYDIRFNAYTPKPCSSTLQQICDIESVKSGGVLVVDDMGDNLLAAREIGAKTAWVHPDANQAEHGWDIAAPSFIQLIKA